MSALNQSQTTNKSMGRDAAIQISQTPKIKFLQHSVKCGDEKARVWYSLDNRTDGRKVVTIYAKNMGTH